MSVIHSRRRSIEVVPLIKLLKSATSGTSDAKTHDLLAFEERFDIIRIGFANEENEIFHAFGLISRENKLSCNAGDEKNAQNLEECPRPY